MPRAVRGVIDVLTAVSLLLCAASVAMCVRSYWVTDTIFLDAHRVLRSEHGFIDLVRYAALGAHGGLWTSSNAKDPSLCYYTVAELAAILPLARLVIACRRSPVARRVAGVALGILAVVSACALLGLLAWRLFGTPITYRSRSWAGNAAWLQGRPAPLSWYSTYKSYDLPLFDGTLPYWLALVLTAVPPAAWVAVRATARRRSRFDPSLCRACGYDLRGTPQRCPECGLVVRQ
jgi:hypothetical protein